MSFGGAASSMNQAIKMNRGLQRKKNQSFFTDERMKSPKGSQRPFQFKTPMALEVKRLKDKYQEERRKERIRSFAGIVIGLIVCAGLIYYLGLFPF